MKHQHTYITIMAGGVGSRFWPYSREHRPKQFLDILGMDKSLIRLTFERFLNIVPANQIFVLTNKQYIGLVSEHIPELPIENIIGEPSRNNTAPCIAYTALKLKKKDPNAVMVVAPSDHFILKEDIFLSHIEQAVSFTQKTDALLTLGIQPTRPDTGYGYISLGNEAEVGIYRVNAFLEKPDLARAEEFLAAGNYVWNAGIFVWKVEEILKQFATHSPQIVNTLSRDMQKYNSEEESAYIEEVYPLTESISIDYAILENADNVYSIPADIGWSDLGTWASLHAFRDKNENDNVVNAHPVILNDTQNCLIQ